MAILDLAILLIIIFGLAFFEVATWLWITVIAVTLILVSALGKLGILSLVIIWCLFLGVAAFASLKTLRIQHFTKPLAKKLQTKMPTISITEREAIEAGDVWWEKELFCGRPKWKTLLNYPAPKLTTEEEDFLNNQVETLCGMLDDWQIVAKDHNLKPEVWEYLKKERFLGMVIPKEYGGRGFSALAHSSVVTKIATRSISAAVNTMVPNSLGPGELLVHYGTDAQKNYYLPRLAKGEEMPCFALTSPEAGSDAGAIVDTGIVCRGMHEGKEIVGIRLTWDKRYITLAPVATVLGLAFRLYDPDHLLGTKEDIGITLCLLPTDHPGVQIGHRHLPMNLAFLNGPTRGKDVFIPLDWIIGGVAKAGQGWMMLMECLSIGRSISLPALSTACAKLSYRTTGAYAMVRKQFNISIANFEGVEEALGSIAGLTYTLEACRIMTAGAVDQKITPSTASAIAKYHMTERARIVLNHSMDVHAGHAIQVGPKNFLAIPHMAIPVSITVEGANILTRNLIIFGQGAIRCHPYVLKEVELLAKQDDKSIKELDSLLMSHVGYLISNVVRSLWYGITGGFLIWSPVRGPSARYYRQLTRMSAALALLSDASMMILGGELKRKERVSARLGDILSQLYIGSSILKYYKDLGQPATDTDSVHWSIQTCLHNTQIAINELADNFPIRWVGKLMYGLIFPFGPAYTKPSDQLDHKIAATMMIPSEFRDRLTRFCYVGNNDSDPIRRLDDALFQQLKIEPLLKKFQRALRDGSVPQEGGFAERAKAALSTGVLTQEEFQALSDFNALQCEVITVDEFAFDLSSVITNSDIGMSSDGNQKREAGSVHS